MMGQKHFRHSFILGFVTVFAIGTFIHQYVTPAASALDGEERETFTVVLKEPTNPENAAHLIQQSGVKILGFNHTTPLGSETVSGGYFVPQKLDTDILSDYRASHLSFLNDMLNSVSQTREPIEDEVAAQAFQRKKENILSELAKSDPFAELKVEEVIVRGNPQQEVELRALPEVETTHHKKDVQAEVNDEGQKTQHANGPASDAVDPSTWVPNQGYSYLYPSIYGGRYVEQDMYWNDWRDLTGFTYASTYEHDFFLNNYDGKTYLSSSQSLNGFPNVSYWSSNLPMPYLDTRVGDNSGEKAYTIGTPQAVAVGSRTWYWYYIRTSDGNTSTDNGKINGQLGYRSPDWCFSVWCSFGDSNTPQYRIVPAWKIPAPGAYHWAR